MVVNIVRKSREPGWSKYIGSVRKAIIESNYIDGTKVIIDPIPHPDSVRDVLEENFKICSDRTFRLILVEDYGNYKIFIQIPDGKNQCDFYVWRAIFEGGLMNVKVPTHNDLATMYNELKSKHECLEEYLINAVIKLIRQDYRWGIPKIISKYFNNLDEKLRQETMKFLAALKWIALQEDVNYPPKEGKMGSRYTLAVYALLEVGYKLNEIRRIIRF